jgi:DNA-binding response OmpR family regulator
MTASIARGLQVGAYACLYKPLAMDELLGVVADISRRKLRTLLGETF